MAPRQRAAAGGLRRGHASEPEPAADETAHPDRHPAADRGRYQQLFTGDRRELRRAAQVALSGMAQPLVTQVPAVAAIWAVLGACSPASSSC
jgi:hypothetical protein